MTSETVGDPHFHASPLDSGGLLVLFGVPWLVDAPPPSLPTSSLGLISVCVSVSVPTFPCLEDSSLIGSGAHPPQLGVHPNSICAYPIFPVWSPLEVLGVRTSTYEFLDDTVQPLAETLGKSVSISHL